MLIKTLLENTAISENFGCEHGLSLYIETKKYRILFDVGGSDLFFLNAEKLNVDIADIDYLIISHGHYDHGGALKLFLKENKKAKIFLHRLAFGQYYALRPDGELDFVGLDKDLKQNKQIVLTSDRFFINDGVQLFSNVLQRVPRPKSNSGLLREYKGQMTDDNFEHEQNLVIEEDGKILLVTGCAHNGIINILEHFQTLKGRMPDCVIGGFHLSRHTGGDEDSEMTDRIGKYLMSTNSKFYTCHCTGLGPYERLKAIMGDSIDYLSTGSVITI